MLNTVLIKIIQDCAADFDSFNDPIKVMPAVPVLWFGDLEEYWKSEKKIVTVALNPSEIEFSSGSSKGFSVSVRFPGLGGKNPYTAPEYYQSMNDYFRINPYMAWFQGPERVLNGLSASYMHGQKYTAVHIDVYAPVATTPHWNGLNSSQRNNLIAGFSQYYERMMEYLDPDIVLASFDSKVIASKFIDVNGAPCTLRNAKGYWKPRGKKVPFLRIYDLPNGKVLITGRNISGSAFAGLTAGECIEGLRELKDFMTCW